MSTKKTIQCPICKDTMDIENCNFVTVRKTEEGETVISCCPVQVKKVKKE
jgi:hypothetical protein